MQYVKKFLRIKMHLINNTKFLEAREGNTGKAVSKAGAYGGSELGSLVGGAVGPPIIGNVIGNIVGEKVGEKVIVDSGSETFLAAFC